MKVYCIKDSDNELCHIFMKGEIYNSKHGTKSNQRGSIWIGTNTSTLGMWFQCNDLNCKDHKIVFENYFITLKEHRNNKLKELGL